MKHTNNHAFTLVELIIVIAVIGVLAAILIPIFSGVIAKANEKSALSDARNTISTIIDEASEKTDIPENVLIFVKKTEKWYLFGYDRSQGGTLKTSVGNPIGSFPGIESINASFGWDGADEPDFTQTYTFGPNRAFYLVPQGYHGSIRSAAFDTRFTNVTSAYDIKRIYNAAEVLIYHGVLLNGTFTFINDAQTASNLFPHISNSPSVPSESPEPTQTPELPRDVAVTVSDTRNGDSTEITISMTGDTILSADIAENSDNAMPYFMADAESYTVSGNAVTVTGTRLARKNGSSYEKYTASGTKTYAADETDCFYVTATKDGFMNIAENLSARYVIISATDTIALGDISPLGSFSGILDGNGKSISFALTDSTGGEGTGLFRSIDTSGRVENLTLIPTSDVIVDEGDFGLLAGGNKGTVADVDVNAASVTAKGLYYVGGLVGVNLGSIDNCSVALANVVGKADSPSSSSGSFTSTYYYCFTGGLCGFNAQYAEITDSTYTGNVGWQYSSKGFGGFCGYNQGAIQNCEYRNGSISKTSSYNSSYVGGFCGVNIGANALIENCSVSGCTLISGTTQIGGFCGASTESAMINSCEVSCQSIQGTGDVGGFCGSLGDSTKTQICTVNSGIAITSTGASTGGFAGRMVMNATAEWCSVKCGASGNSLSGTSELGGFAGTAGYSTASRATIKYCQSDWQKITSTNSSAVGGFCGAGKYVTITDCISRVRAAGDRAWGAGSAGFIVDTGKTSSGNSVTVGKCIAYMYGVTATATSNVFGTPYTGTTFRASDWCLGPTETKFNLTNWKKNYSTDNTKFLNCNTAAAYKTAFTNKGFNANYYDTTGTYIVLKPYTSGYPLS